MTDPERAGNVHTRSAAHDEARAIRNIEKSAVALYSKLRPDTWADREVLERIVGGTEKSEIPFRQLVAGACALELSVHPANYRKQRKAQIKRANRLLRVAALTNTALDESVRAQRLVETCVLMQQGPHPSSRATFTRATTERFCSLVDILCRGMDSRGDQGNMQGLVQEEAVIALIENIGKAGLVAYTSLPRQDGNKIRIDGKKYSWDVTVESDGSLVPFGRYFVQCKSAPVLRKHFEYHPDIAVVPAYAPTLFSRFLDPTNNYAAIQATLSDPAANGHGAEMRRMQDLILGALDVTGPASQDLVLLR